MTTLTIYFALSPTSTSSSLSTPTTIQSFRLLTSRTQTKPLTLPNLSMSSPSSSVPKLPVREASSKRNRTFFERFNQTSPGTSQSQQQQNDPSNEPQTRLRRRLTFRRSLRQSVRNKGGDIDDGIRSVFYIPYDENIFVPIHHRRDR
jgi:hypothetical protein